MGNGEIQRKGENMKNNEKAEFLEQMINEVRELPVEDIVGREVQLYQRGQYYFGLCPFHPDNNLGSFVVTPSKNLWRCFACGVGGTGISFVMQYYEIGFLEACFKLAVDFSIITAAEAEKFSRKHYDPSMIKHIEKEALSEHKDEFAPDVAPADVVHNVYEAMAAVCKLNETHKAHLINERHLAEDELSDFFSFPTRRFALAAKILQEIEKRLRNRFDDENQIQIFLKRVEGNMSKVPGFYINTFGKLDFVSYKGIAFLIRDEKRCIRGIQIRRDTVKPKESRYVWFSSAFALRTEGCEGGAPSGSPGGYVASNGNKKILCITEGRFKAEAIAKAGLSCAYVSGVSSWKSIIPMIESLTKKQKNVSLVFDADMLGNWAVHEQLLNLVRTLKANKCQVSLLLWSKLLGKGFDDLYNNTNGNIKPYCKSFQFDVFERKYQDTLQAVLNSFNAANTREVKTEMADAFAEKLQTENEKAFSLKIEY